MTTKPSEAIPTAGRLPAAQAKRSQNCKGPSRVIANAMRPRSIFSFQFSVFNLVSFLAFSHLHAGSSTNLRIEERALKVIESCVTIQNVKVFIKGSEQPLFGAFRDGVFVPAVPFVRGQRYQVALELADGSKSSTEVVFGDPSHGVLTVQLSPSTSIIPANTLKLYLDFSEPMEQGVLLKHLTLQRQNGKLVTGAFRETELWSPDGKRLTVMLHPGRQKTGVNLNLDEGPVLIAGERYYFIVSGEWRSTTGEPLGKDVVFGIESVAADHEQPNPQNWKVIAPAAGTRSVLLVTTDELFEPRIFARALQVPGVDGKAEARVVDPKRMEWRFIPDKPWKAGGYEITIPAELEDLAGNNLLKPMEVDLTAPRPEPRRNSIMFRVSAR